MFNIQKSEELIAFDEIVNIDQISSFALKTFISNTKTAYNMFWFGSTSPSMKAKLMGANAVAMFTVSAMAQAFIKSMDSKYVELSIPNGYEINWNNDGSCEITGEYIDPNLKEEEAEEVKE